MRSVSHKRIRVLLVDDHEIVRVGLVTLLEQYPDMMVAGQASTVAGAVSEAARVHPDVVLLDIRLPDGCGLEACKQIQELPGKIRVLILTSFGDEESVFQAIQAGADGYLLKEIDADALVAAIRRVATGQSVLDPAVTGGVFGRLKSPTAAMGRDKIETLSAQERRVLALVADGLTNKQIAVEMGLSDKTVKNYLSHVLEKLDLHRRSQAAAFFVQHTYSK